MTELEKYADELHVYAALKKKKLARLESYENTARDRENKINDIITSAMENLDDKYNGCKNEVQRKAFIATKVEDYDKRIASIENDIRSLDAEIDISTKMISYWKRATEHATALLKAK